VDGLEGVIRPLLTEQHAAGALLLAICGAAYVSG
jgi:hypothetical protein